MEPEGSVGTADEVGERRWPRVAGLLVLCMAMAVFRPSVLIGVPFVLLAIFMPGPKASGLLMAAPVLVLLTLSTGPDGVWYLERGWAVLVGGWFVAITWRWPALSFTNRALAALGGTVAVLSIYFATNPATWQLVDWVVGSRFGSDLIQAFEAFRVLANVDGALVTSFYDSVEPQVAMYPALIALSTLAGLGVAWWIHMRLSHGTSGGLGAFREFIFPDGLIWVVIAGVVLVLVGSGWATRVGTNTLVFMGALYAMRGIAVLAFFKGSISFFGAALAIFVALIAAPMVMGVAVVVGVGDTWLGLRERARNALSDV